MLSIRISEKLDRLIRQDERSLHKDRSEVVREMIEKVYADRQRKLDLDQMVKEIKARSPETIAEMKAIHADFEAIEEDRLPDYDWGVAEPAPPVYGVKKKSKKKAKR